ncbi:hypothetical protein E2C01_080933 [Portunus trituberculatus]|uniref:Uncharacterized protein n=1 Tax=Portunus trituberculatus TaxID=210409 RepID=A0A5B7IXC1_PORTR|nr:hypothetical protein [Portunus trituberculatus]
MAFGQPVAHHHGDTRIAAGLRAWRTPLGLCKGFPKPVAPWPLTDNYKEERQSVTAAVTCCCRRESHRPVENEAREQLSLNKDGLCEMHPRPSPVPPSLPPVHPPTRLAETMPECDN